MGEVFFYHLTRSTLEDTLANLLPRALGQGWRVMLRGGDAARRDWLDQKLWLGEGFLPHGQTGGPHDALQPVLIAPPGTSAAGCDCLMVHAQDPITAAEAAAIQRGCVFFDANDPQEMESARALWRSLSAENTPAQYWSEETGRWEKKAQSRPPA